MKKLYTVTYFKLNWKLVNKHIAIKRPFQLFSIYLIHICLHNHNDLLLTFADLVIEGHKMIAYHSSLYLSQLDL